VRELDIELFKKYKKLGRGNWGKDLGLWKTLYNGALNQIKEEEFTPLTEMMLDVFLSVPDARREGNPIIMYPFNYEPHIFHAMNLTPLMQEVFSVGLAPFHLNEPYIDVTNQIGYGDNPTLCNAQRPLIGSYMQGAAPIPDLLFFLATPCNSLAMTYQVFQNLTSVPTYSLDIPYWAYDQKNEFYDEKIMDYMIKQKKELINWLEIQTGRKLTAAKLQKTLELVNEARENILEFNELLKTEPCPLESLMTGLNFLVMILRAGTKDAVNVTKYLRDLAKENVKNGISGVPDEKIRIGWPYTHIFFDNELFPWLEENFGASIIMDILGYYQVPPHDVSTLGKCYESLAMGTLDYAMIGTCRGPMEYLSDYIINYVKDYKLDCVVFPLQWACKHAFSIARVSSELLRRETGVPSLIFGCDPYDSREVSSEAIRAKISEFLTQVVL
jgi:benzoyl-CoA reductase/2-hydroxyglutaryl-CoA dehydratase subunit BcrC/BadD/HgdB